MSAVELQEQQERLLALVNVLGFTSLDHLEDYVILHGAARVVPTSSVASHGASLAVEDTQSQVTSYADTGHAQRNRERKRENLRLKGEIEEVRKELKWLRKEHEKHIATIESLCKDKSRLLGLAERDNADEAGQGVSAAETRAGSDPGGSESCGAELAALAGEASALFDHVTTLEETIVQLQEAQQESEERLVSIRHDYDDAVARLQEDQVKLDRLSHELSRALDEREGVVEQRNRLQVELNVALAENNRYRKVESEHDDLKRLVGNLVAKPSVPQSVRVTTPVASSSARTRRSHGLNLSVHDITSNEPTRQRDATPAASTLSTPAVLPPNVAPSLPSLAPDIDSPRAAETGSTLYQLTRSKSSPSTDGPRQSRDQPTSGTLPLSHHGSQPEPSSMYASVSRAQPEESNASSSRLKSVQIRQLKQYPQLLSAYLKAVLNFSVPQTWANSIIPSINVDVLASLPPPPVATLYPSFEFPVFEELAIQHGPDGNSRSSWVEDGSLQRRYEELEACEKRAVQRLLSWQHWITGAKDAVRRHKVQETREKRGTAPEMTTDAVSSVRKTLVKKKRRISKEGATPGSSSFPLTPTGIASPSCAPRSSAVAEETPLARTVMEEDRKWAQAHGFSPLGEIHKQSVVTPKCTKSTADEANAQSTSRKRKNWNLLSPKKSSNRPKTTEQQIFRSPSKSSPAKQRMHFGLVDSTQAAQREKPVTQALFDAEESAFEAEPDTLDSTANQESAGVHLRDDTFERSRSETTSRSPQKQLTPSETVAASTSAMKSPLRRPSAASRDTTLSGPKPPFSPAYAAKMQKAGDAATCMSPTSPPQARLFAARRQHSRSPLQPSPNLLSQQARSASISPVKIGLPMPLSTQRSPRSRSHGEDPPVAELRAGTPQQTTSRGLLFKHAISANPTESGAKDDPAAVTVKLEHSTDDPFAYDVPKSSKLHAGMLSSPVQQPPRGSTAENGGRTAKRSRKNLELPRFARGDEEDQKPRTSQEPESEDIGPMPMGSAEQAGRELWIRKLRNKRHEKIVRDLQRRKQTQPPSPALQVELNPDRNQGEKHAFKQTERRKAVRQSMLAEACSNCKAYYERKKQAVPVGHCTHVDTTKGSPQTAPLPTGEWLESRAADAERRLQQDGRHRAAQRTAPDPPDYWQMGFPSTQQAERINERARQQKAEQEKLKIVEAEQANGLYRFRNERDSS